VEEVEAALAAAVVPLISGNHASKTVNLDAGTLKPLASTS
jgi:hypothetical protein